MGSLSNRLRKPFCFFLKTIFSKVLESYVRKFLKQIFSKVDFLPIDNDSEKKKEKKKYKPLQIPHKLLVTLLLSTSCNAQN